MDVVLVGLSGSGKSEVARLVAERSGAELVDLDAEVERAAGRSIAAIFAEAGEAAFRALERTAVEGLPPPSGGAGVGRVIAAGGGAIVDPRNRWRLYRGRLVVWLDAPTEVLASRVAATAEARPLLAGDAADAAGVLGRLRAERAPWYAAADVRIDTSHSPDDVVGRVEAAIAVMAARQPGQGASDGADGVDSDLVSGVLLTAESPVGRVVVGSGIAAGAVDVELRGAGATRAVILTEPGAQNAVGDALAARLAARGWPLMMVELPRGEKAKRLPEIESIANRLVGLGIERGEPIVAVGGGALTDAAGFVAAITLRGLPWIAVPTTLAAQIDAAIGGKTAANLESGKNLVGAFHPPLATVADVALLATLPERDRRAAMAEAVKVAFLGEERLLELLEAAGAAITSGEASAYENGALAELVERAALFKLAVVSRDREEQGERIALNLGHTLGHALEASAGFGTLLHGEAVAYGLRLAGALALARGAAGHGRIERLERLLDRLDLAIDQVSVEPAAVIEPLRADKKRRGGRVRWVLPTDDGWTVDDGIPDELVETSIGAVLEGRAVAARR